MSFTSDCFPQNASSHSFSFTDSFPVYLILIIFIIHRAAPALESWSSQSMRNNQEEKKQPEASSDEANAASASAILFRQQAKRILSSPSLERNLKVNYTLISDILDRSIFVWSFYAIHSFIHSFIKIKINAFVLTRSYFLPFL